MEELRLKKEAEIEGSGGEGGGGGGGDGMDAAVGGKKVRFREQEWAVLGSDLSSVGVGGGLRTPWGEEGRREGR